MDNFVVHRPVEPSLEIRPASLVLLPAAAPAAAPVRHPSLPEGCLAAAVVDLDAVAANVAALREHAAGAQLMAVVKADGYGHGMVPVARAALAGGADRLGGAHPRGGPEPRGARLDAPGLAWRTVARGAHRAAGAPRRASGGSGPPASTRRSSRGSLCPATPIGPPSPPASRSASARRAPWRRSRPPPTPWDARPACT